MDKSNLTLEIPQYTDGFGVSHKYAIVPSSGLLLTTDRFPFIGPRFLNSVSTFDSKRRVSHTHMKSYYDFIKGKSLSFFGFHNPASFATPLDLNFPCCIDRDNYIYSFDDYYYRPFSHYQSGYIEHLPHKTWCIQTSPTTFMIKNEIDCVGYSGTGCFARFPSGLQGSCILAQNILPSLHAPEINCIRNEPIGLVYLVNSQYNFVRLSDGVIDIYVQVNDYDCISLATKTNYFPGLDYFIGRQGLVYDSNLYCPNVFKMDGYRFWYWMYHGGRFPRNFVDNYFAGTSKRIERYNKSIEEDIIYSPSPLFKGSNKDTGSNVTLQGGTFSTLNSLVDSVTEIGQFARTANEVKVSVDEYVQQPWFQTIVHYLTSVAQNIHSLVQDFYAFQQDPSGFIKRLLAGYKHDFSFPEHFVYDTTKTGLMLAAGVYLFEKSQVLSVGLFLFGYHSFFNHCYTNKAYARSAAIVTTLVSIGVMKATQLRPASITLQSPSSLTHMIYTACAFVTLGFAATGLTTSSDSVVKHLFTNTKDIFALSRGTLSLAKCVEFIVSSLQMACEYVFGDGFAYNTLVKMMVTSKDLQEYIQYCLVTQPEDLATKLTLDLEARKQWDKICVLHKDLIKVFSSGKPPTETHIGYSMYVRACTNFNKLRLEYGKIKDSLDHFRAEPFMVWLWGEPGTGKTWCRDRFVNNMYRWHATIDNTLPDVKRTGLLYVRNPADKFMSKYNGEFAVAYDDVGQNRQQDNPEFNEIMGFGSTNQVRLNMADLEDKGRLFSSRVVIMAANSKGVCSNQLILKDSAFNRRRHIVVEIDRPKLETNTLSTSKCDFSKVRLSLSDPITGDDVISFPKEGYGDDEATFRELFEWLAPKYVKHVEEQLEGLARKERALEAILNGEPDASIVDLPRGDLAEEFPPIDPLLDVSAGKFRRLARLAELDVEVELLLDSIRNHQLDGLEAPPPFMVAELNEICRVNGIEPLEDKEWNFFKGNTSSLLTQEELDGVQEIWDHQINNMAKKSPWLVLLKNAALIASCAALYHFARNYFSGKEDIFELQGYNLDTKAQPTPRVVAQAYTHETKAQSTPRVITQSYSHEPQAQKSNKMVLQRSEVFGDLEEKLSNIDTVNVNLAKSVARFIKLKETGAYFIVNGFNVCYNAWLLPRHFFGKEITDMHVQVERDGMSPEVVLIRAEHVTRYFKMDYYGKEYEKDLCIVRIPQLSHGRNHLKHFASAKQLEMCRTFNGKVIKWNAARKRIEDALVGEAIRWDKPMAIDQDGMTLHFSSGYKYNFDTQMGDCGSLLVSLDKTTSARIYGIHFGFDNVEQRGLSHNVCREDLEILVMGSIPKVDRIDMTEPIVELQSAECPQELFNTETGYPYFEHLGYVRDGPLPPRDHGDLHRSPLYGEVYEAEKDLSVLNKYDSRMEEEARGDPDILVRGVIDFAYDSYPWPQQELGIAQEALGDEFSNFKDPLNKKVLSLDEAINGIWIDGARIENSEPINLKTSAGYGLVGIKKEHFITKEIRDLDGKIEKVEHSITSEKLSSQCNDMWISWMNGKTYSIPWSHTLKVEALKLSKIKSGNTRTFCVASTAFLLNVRRLFGAFTAAMKSSKIRSFSGLGIDANSQDWNDLYNNLVSTGPRGADMDFFKFDRTAVTWQLALAVCQEINKWYDDGEQNARARIIAFEEMIFAYGLINKHLTRKRRGNPSGNPLTTELNNCVNYLMLCMVYMLIARKISPSNYSIRAWKRNVNMKAYGDDIIFTLHPECEQWFSFEMLEEIYKYYGVPVTPADKSDAGITLRPLHELTFLKREFRPYDHPIVKWQSALSQTSIKNMVQFYRLKPNNGTMMEAVRTNCYESLVEAHHWGEDFFNSHKQKLNDWMKSNDFPLFPITFTELDVVYRAKLDGRV